MPKGVPNNVRKRCKACRTTFTTASNRQAYCSPSCRRAASNLRRFPAHDEQGNELTPVQLRQQMRDSERQAEMKLNQFWDAYEALEAETRLLRRKASDSETPRPAVETALLLQDALQYLDRITDNARFTREQTTLEWHNAQALASKLQGAMVALGKHDRPRF